MSFLELAQNLGGNSAQEICAAVASSGTEAELRNEAACQQLSQPASQPAGEQRQQQQRLEKSIMHSASVCVSHRNSAPKGEPRGTIITGKDAAGGWVRGWRKGERGRSTDAAVAIKRRRREGKVRVSAPSVCRGRVRALPPASPPARLPARTDGRMDEKRKG